MDIKEFYPSVSEETLNKAINFAENHTLIFQENRKSYFNHLRELLNYKKITDSPYYFTTTFLLSDKDSKSTTKVFVRFYS